MKRRQTERGLGLPGPALEEESPPVSRIRVDPSARPNAATWPAAEAVTGTGTHHRFTGPMVDDVGDAAVRIARSSRPPSAPKLSASGDAIAKAPIDTRSAFVLSLVDGRNTASTIVDMSGMQADEVNGILARLARLGLIVLP